MYRFIALFILTLTITVACDSSQQATTSSGPRTEFEPNEYEKVFGDYIVHINAFTTDLLTADVAKVYKIRRSKNLALLNVVVMKMENGERKPVTASVAVLARNMANQVKNITMRKITEEDAIYYIDDIAVENAETIIFDIDVTPEGTTETYHMTYVRQFFTN